ncbi:MAG: hypothetical protein P8Y29_07190, partial [Gemmatimonadota bacterium]
LPRAANAQDDMEPVTISIYHVAPGQHMAFLEWMAEREEITAQVGTPDTQWYMHMDGDSWDFLGIAPATTDEQDEAIEEMARARGLTVGPAAAIELRTMIASHTDTEAAGPMTAPEILETIRNYGSE